jgi:serine/threonine protein kinase
METRKPGPDSNELSRAEQLFLDYLKRVEAGEPLEFDELCAAHAELEQELRELHEGQAWARDVGLEGQFPAGSTLGGEAGDPTAGDDPLLGELFHLKYRIVRRIGRGGFGTVYEATDERGAGNPVAIKVLSGRAAESAVHQESFRDEARRVTRLSHPNVVDWKVFDQTDEGLSYFVMELVPGEKFDLVLKQERTIEPDRAARLLLQIVDALRAAHHLSETESILHLDLKPDNLFLIPAQLGREEQMKVIDFGIGQYIGDEQVEQSEEVVLPSGTLLEAGPSTLTFATPAGASGSRPSKVKRSHGCTPEYASPEQVAHVLGKEDIVPLDGRSDLYSLGVIAFQMLTGRLPFQSRGNRLDVLRMHRDEPAPTLASAGARVPKGLARFVERCLAKDRDARWRDTQEAYEYLHDLVHPPVWKAVAKVTVPLVLAGGALGAWALTTREAPVPTASLSTEDGADLEAQPLHLGPARTAATLRVASTEGGSVPTSGAWRVVRAEDGTPLAGWSADWDGAGRVTLAAPADLDGRLEQRVQLRLGADRLHSRTFTAVWLGAKTWTVPAVELAGRGIDQLAGVGVDPVGVALDVWVAGPARADLAAVGVRRAGGELLTLQRQELAARAASS